MNDAGFNTAKLPSAFLSNEPNLRAFISLTWLGILARGFQFLVPLLIYSFLPPSKDVDFYFYWTAQSNLIATFLVSIWPTALMAIIVKARSQNDQHFSLSISVQLLKKFFYFSIFIATIVFLLAANNYLGGSKLSPSSNQAFFGQTFFWALPLTVLCSALALALAEVGTAHRKFGIGFIGLIASAFVQVSILISFRAENVLMLSFCLGCLTQFIVTLLLLASSLDLKPALKTVKSDDKIQTFIPKLGTLSLIYLGGFFTLLAAHLSFRILENDALGSVSAFGIASMLALAPQQLIIQHLSTVAGVTMTEAYHNRREDFLRVRTNWRNRLFRTSLTLGFAMQIFSCAILLILPHLVWANSSWLIVAQIMLFLSLPLAMNGLNTWLSRLTASVERLEIGTYYQIISNLVTIILLLAFARLPLPFSTPLALAVGAAFQLITIPVFVRFLFKSR